MQKPQGWWKQSTIKTTDRMWPRTQWDHLLPYIVENFTKENLGHSNKQKGRGGRGVLVNEGMNV